MRDENKSVFRMGRAFANSGYVSGYGSVVNVEDWRLDRVGSPQRHGRMNGKTAKEQTAKQRLSLRPMTG